MKIEVHNFKDREKAYRQSKLISQSTLKKVDAGLEEYKKETKSSGFFFGNLVDDLLTTDKDYFKSNYCILKTEKPTGKVLEIIEKTFELGGKTLDSEEFRVAIDSVGYYPKQSLDKKVERLMTPNNIAYFDFLVSSVGKTLIDLEELDKGFKATDNFRESRMTGSFFKGKKTTSTEVASILSSCFTFDFYSYGIEEKDIISLDIYYQFPVYDHKKKRKGLLDILWKVSTKMFSEEKGEYEKVFLIPVDIKTMSGSPYDFPKQSNKFRYDIQAAYYTDILKAVYSDFEICDFIFLVVSSTNLNIPALKYTSDKLYLAQGREGLKNSYTGDMLMRGYTQLEEILSVYQNTDFKEDIRSLDKDSIKL